MASDPDSKASWKRRALRAEERARRLDSLLTSVQRVDRGLIYKAADLQTAINMIKETLDWYMSIKDDAGFS